MSVGKTKIGTAVMPPCRRVVGVLQVVLDITEAIVWRLLFNQKDLVAPTLNPGHFSHGHQRAGGIKLNVPRIAEVSRHDSSRAPLVDTSRPGLAGAIHNLVQACRAGEDRSGRGVFLSAGGREWQETSG